MSEYEPRLETHNHHEKLVDPEHHKAIEKALRAKAERARAEQSGENLKLLHELAKQHAEKSHKIAPEDLKDKEPDSLLGMQQALKANAYAQTLRNVQQRLPKSARLFSQVAHNKTIESISETTAKTVARPSGLLGGSLCAFTGSLALLYYSKHYGFTYNYALFLLLFVGGFLIGASIELIIWLMYRSKNGRY